MNARQESLGRRDGTLKALDDLSQRISNLGFFLELRFEICEDCGIEEA